MRRSNSSKGIALEPPEARPEAVVHAVAAEGDVTVRPSSDPERVGRVEGTAAPPPPRDQVGELEQPLVVLGFDPERVADRDHGDPAGDRRHEVALVGFDHLVDQPRRRGAQLPLLAGDPLRSEAPIDERPPPLVKRVVG